MLKPSDLKILLVEKTDYKKVFDYTENNFSKKRYNSDTIKSDWINQERKLNPNFTGILGEWILNSDNDPDLTVEEFLAERPLISDAGDGLAFPFCYPRAITTDGVVFDIKTAGWMARYNFSLSAVNFRALVLKRLNIYGERPIVKNYEQIEAFVFGIFMLEKMQCVFTGWYDKQELFQDAELVEKEFETGNGKVTHEYYAIPHSDLKPFSDLLCRGFKRITSLTMKDKNFNI